MTFYRDLVGFFTIVNFKGNFTLSVFTLTKFHCIIIIIIIIMIVQIF